MAAIDIRFIALKAGVSPATVSRVMNGTKKVSPELAARVLETVDRYQYSPNLNARSLVHHRTKLIGIVTPNVSGSFHAALISEIEKALELAGYAVIVSNFSGDPDQEFRTFRMMRERVTDGVILLHENTEAEFIPIRQSFHAPIVLASVQTESDADYSVSIDDERAAYDAARVIIENGHRRIAGVFSASYSAGTLRKRGFRRALSEAGLGPVLEITASCTLAGGIEAAETIGRSASAPTAVFFMSDEAAIGAIRKFRDLGIRVPDDLSIVSFDDIPYSDFVTPRLTTVRQPIQRIGSAAAELLLRRIQGEEGMERKVYLPHSLTIRESCVRAA